jgi:hypothetical protein
MATLLDATYLLNKLELTFPLIGVYDAPVDSEFNPVVQLLPQKRTCLFAYFNAWMRGQTLRLSATNHGCLGAGYWMFGREGRTRQSMVNFLVDDEGLSCSKESMNRWLDASEPYHTKHKNLFIGPLRSSMNQYLKSVTFFVNPDQLSSLVVAANYFSDGRPVSQVTVPFGSGCMQLLAQVDGHDDPHALVGATDLAMRKYLPAHVLAFTVNMPMFERLCAIGKDSFLEKPFFTDLQKQRGAK